MAEYRDVFDSSGNHAIRIIHFADLDPYNPNAWPDYKAFVSTMHAGGVFSYYKTIIQDSASFMEIAARKYEEYVANPVSPSERQQHQLKYFGASAYGLEEAVWYHTVSWPTNLVLVCHVERDKDERQGYFVHTPLLRGKGLRGKIGAAYQEIYRAYIGKDAEGNDFYALQTKLSNQYDARTMIHAPDPCYPDYAALWNGQRPWTDLHCLVYGPPGSGKTTFASTWPKPMLVLFFDPPGKDLPYYEKIVKGGGTITDRTPLKLTA